MVIFPLLVTLGAPSPPSDIAPREQRKERTQVSFLGYGDGRCAYMTGDVVLSENDYAGILRTYYDHSRTMTILYTPNVPESCVKRAREIAIRAGLNQVVAKRWTKELEDKLSR